MLLNSDENSLDLNATLSEIKECFNNVNKWAKPESPPFALNWFFMKPHTRKEPKGVVLVIGPFNFPVWCLIGPCVSFPCVPVVSFPHTFNPRLLRLLLAIRLFLSRRKCVLR